MNALTKDRSCIVCGTAETFYLFRVQGTAIVICSGCSLLSRSPFLPSRNETLPTIQRSQQAKLWEAGYIEKLLNGSRCRAQNILVVWQTEEQELTNKLTGKGPLFTFKKASELASLHDYNRFDCVILHYVLDKSDNPVMLLTQSHDLLKQDGQLLIVGTQIIKQSAPGRIGQQRSWQADTNLWFSRSTLQLLLEKRGFHRISLSSDGYSNGFRAVVSARKAIKSSTRRLSIIMPVYNENKTFSQAFSLVANKRIEGIDETEIIIVESNSKDGSREAVHTAAAGRSNVKAIFEDKAQGKGHAVREGFKHCTGEIVLIQDADLEYDINDYDALVKPLLEYKETLVIGTRHKGDWKIRQFASQEFSALVCNVGHIFFTWLVNSLYKQSLSDPFTMFKVFRRECLYGLRFECNRFDFDHELLIKLIRKGYEPVEIPINYRSRSFSEGKKVTFFRDPLTWLKADFKYRFANPFVEQNLYNNEREPETTKSYEPAKLLNDDGIG